MIKKIDSLFESKDKNQRLKVIHNKNGKYEVFFPFTEVPIEMSASYFKKNINPDQYIIDFNDEYDHPKAG